MRKKIIQVICILLAVSILYSTLVTRVYRKEIRISLSYLKINQQISSINNIAKWYLPFSSSDTSNLKILGKDRLLVDNSELSITKLTGLRSEYKITENNQSGNIVFDLVPVNADSTMVILSYESTIWNKLLANKMVITNAEKSLHNLKEYFEDTKKMYGYEIEKAEVTDTAFLFRSSLVSNANKKESFKMQFESLIQFAKEKDLGYTGTRIFYFNPFGKDSIHLFTSIGITNTDRSKFNEKFLLKQMPYHGRLLTAYYQGSINNVNRVINALEQYRTDNTMTSMAIPFTKLITEGIEFDDNQVIQAKVFYPVY